MNKKGFTLVELLAVLIILALISGIAIPSITKSLKNARENAYNKQIATLESAAKKWGANNDDKLPTMGVCCSIIKGDGTNIGDEIVCGDEHFFVLENDGIYIKMITAHNLNLDINNPVQTIISQTLTFSDEAYWINIIYDEEGEFLDTELKPEYGLGGSTFVYDEYSNLYKYVEAYERYLKRNGLSTADASLLDGTLLSSVISYGSTFMIDHSFWTGIGSYDAMITVSNLIDVHDIDPNYESYPIYPIITIPATLQGNAKSIVNFETLINEGYLKDEPLINHKTKEHLEGCIMISYDNNYNQYKYEYINDMNVCEGR